MKLWYAPESAIYRALFFVGMVGGNRQMPSSLPIKNVYHARTYFREKGVIFQR